MSDFEIPKPNIIAEPTADIIITENEDGLFQNEKCQIKPKNIPNDEFLRLIKLSDIKQIYQNNKKIKKIKIQWDEISLAISTLGIGTTLSAFISKISKTDEWATLFYNIIPLISTASIVFTIMFKIMKKNNITDSASIIENIIFRYFTKKELGDKDES